MNPGHLSSKLFYSGACGALATGSDTRQASMPGSGASVAAVIRPLIFRIMVPFLLTGVASHGAYANPELDAVQMGDISMDLNDSVMTIDQGSDKAIIHWQDFSIGAGETTNFVMPSASSAVLNRVTGVNMSSIMGALNANGQVYLINPNGIVVGADGVINTQSFIASTLDVSNTEFMVGGDLTFAGDSQATIINMGQMEAHGGDVFLIAREVENIGGITAGLGTIGMAAGRYDLRDQMRLLIFHDYTTLGNNNRLEGEQATNLASAGLGMRYNLGRQVSLNLDYGWQLMETSPGAGRDEQLHASLELSF